MNLILRLRIWWHHNKPGEADRRIHLRFTALDYKVNAILRKVERLEAIEPALGRIIAKLDPRFSTDEIDADRKADSDALGRIVIAKLLAEDAARRHTTGEL